MGSADIFRECNEGEREGWTRVSYRPRSTTLSRMFGGLSTQRNYPQYENLFESTLSRFAELTDARRINVQPDRIRVRRAAKADTLGNALRALGVPENRIKEMSLLNGGVPDESVPPNILLKVVERGR